MGGMPVILTFAETQLHFPPGQVCVNQYITPGNKRCADTVDEHQTAFNGVDFLLRSVQGVVGIEVPQTPGRHDAKDRVVGQFMLDFCVQRCSGNGKFVGEDYE